MKYIENLILSGGCSDCIAFPTLFHFGGDGPENYTMRDIEADICKSFSCLPESQYEDGDCEYDSVGRSHGYPRFSSSSGLGFLRV